MYRKGISLALCLLLLWAEALAAGTALTDYGDAVRLGDLLPRDGMYTVTFFWEDAEFIDGAGQALSSPHQIETVQGGTLAGLMPVLAGEGRVVWRDPNGQAYEENSPIYANTQLTAQIWQGYRITLMIDGAAYEIIAQGPVTQAQMIAPDGTDFALYAWKDEAGRPVTLLGYAPEGDVTLTADTAQGTVRTLHCMVYLDGEWEKVGQIGRVYGPHEGRYYLTSAQLASAFGPYGFDAGQYAAASGTWFGQAMPGQNIWSNGGVAWLEGQKITKVFAQTNTAPEFYLYYMPGQAHNNVAAEAAKEHNRIWRVRADIPGELEGELGAGRVLAYVPGYKAGDSAYSTQVRLPTAEGIRWSWRGEAEVQPGEGGSFTLTAVRGPVTFIPGVAVHSVVFETGRGTYTYGMNGGEDLGQWVRENAQTLIGTGAAEATGEAETRTFGQLDWRHLNGSQAGTVLSPGWIIGEGEPRTLRLEGLPKERVLRLQAGGDSGTAAVDLNRYKTVYQWLQDNGDLEIALDNGTALQVGRFMWADGETGVPVSGQQPIDMSQRPYGEAIRLTGTPRTYYTVTLKVKHTGDTQPCTVTRQVELNQNLIAWLNWPENATLTIDQGCVHAGETVKRDDYRYTLEDGISPIPQDYGVTRDLVLYAHPRSYTAVVLEYQGEGQTYSAEYPAEQGKGYERGMPLLHWLEDHGADPFAGKRVHDFAWRFNDQPVTSAQVVYSGSAESITLTAQPKASFTVNFGAGTGAWEGETPEGVQVLAGDRVSGQTLQALAEKLVPPDGHSFTGWAYDGDGGTRLPFDESTRVTGDMAVYAVFAICHQVTFYTDASLQTRIAAGGFTNPVAVPEGQTIPAGAYPYQSDPQWVPDGQAFRYWVRVMDSGDHLVFSVNDPIQEDVNLYPVFTRIVYIFRDGQGRQLTSAYQGEAIRYVPQEVPQGKYYMGLQVEGGLIPNGTMATPAALTKLGVIVPAAGNGARVFENARPVFGDQGSVIYHGDRQSQFMNGEKTYVQTAEGAFIALGLEDIRNTAGQVLAGWALTEGGQAAYQPGQAVDSAAVSWDANRELHLYPVWRQEEGTVKVTFAANYPAGALGPEGEKLEEASYQVYLPVGAQPVLPLVERTGFPLPANKVEVDGRVVNRYSVAGWSIHPQGEQAGDRDGVYSPGTQYAHGIQQEITFYLRWLDQGASAENTWAYFFIRDDRSLPQEPGSFSGSAYYPQTTQGGSIFQNGLNGVQGALKVLTNVVNDTAAVRANLSKEPRKEDILLMLRTPQTPPSATLAAIKDLERDAWYVEWYAIKKEGEHWHVDGRVRLAGHYRLDYFPNGGGNVPLSTTHSPGTRADVSFRNANRFPQRQGYNFLGWSEDSWATQPDAGLALEDERTAEMHMTSDKKLYAVWAPVSIPLPRIYGEKYMRTVFTQTGGGQTRQTETKELYAGHADAYSATMRLESAPADIPGGPKAYQAKLDAHGCFTIPGETFSFPYPGKYVFAITEDIPANADPAVAYDTATYRLTLHLVQGESGLQIAGAEMDRNGVRDQDFQLAGGKAAFAFTNVTGLRDVTVRKVWEDGNDAHGLRPDSLTVSLVNQTTQKTIAQAGLSPDNGWTHTFENVPTRDGDGTAIAYTVTEGEFPHEEDYESRLEER